MPEIENLNTNTDNTGDLNLAESTETVDTAALPTAPAVAKPGRASIRVAREDMTAAIASEWLEVKTDVFTLEEHGVDAQVKNLYWKKPVLGRPAGSFAGQRRPEDDYYSVVLLGNSYSGARVIALLETGVWPPERTRSGTTAQPRSPLTIRTAPVPLTEAQKAAKRAELKAKDEAAKAAKAAAKAGTPVADTAAVANEAAPVVESVESVETLTGL